VDKEEDKSYKITIVHVIPAWRESFFKSRMLDKIE
jgi:hypothetical protein